MLTAKSADLQKARKYLFRTMLVVLSVVLGCVIAVVAYVSFNKKKIIRLVTTEISERMSGKVDIGNMDLSFFRSFPHLSVLLNNVTITDTLYHTHHHPFFTGKEVFVRIDLLNVISKQPPIKGIKLQNGQLYLYTDSTGYTNKYLMQFKKDTASAAVKEKTSNQFKQLHFQNVHLVVDDHPREKLHDLAIAQLKMDVRSADTLLVFHTKANIFVKSLAFNTNKGSYIKDKTLRGQFNLFFDRTNRVLSFDSIDIQLDKQPFNMSGRFAFAGAQRQFNLRINTNNVTYGYIKSVLPPRLASKLAKVTIDQITTARITVDGPLGGGEPKVHVSWAVNERPVSTRVIAFDKASFTGYYTNEEKPGLPRNDSNSIIAINGFTAEWYGLPVRSQTIRIELLKDAQLHCDLSSDFAMTRLNELIGSNTLYLLDGNGNIRLRYDGPLDTENGNAFINGTIGFNNALIEYAPRGVQMKNVNGKLLFRNSDVLVENLQCVVLNNNITMNGHAERLLSLINTEPDKANINWNIHMPVMNLGSFVYLFKSRSAGKRTAGKKATFQAMADKIDRFIEQGRLQVKLDANKMTYKNFACENVLADITLLNDRYVINKVKLDHSGGHMEIKGSLLNQSNFHQANLEVNMNNVNVRKVFADFNNFGQDGLTAQSLEGKLSADIEAAMAITPDGQVVPSTIVSRVDFSLKDGALNNYEPIKKLQKFVFKKRDFDNIRFAELKNRLEIKNQEITINRMEIQSTVLSLFVEGVYNNKGTTNLQVQVPLSNLKKRDEDYNPENIGTDKKGGSSIFLRGQPGEDGTIKFKLDLFKRYNKEKKQADSTTNLPYQVTGD